MIDTENLYTASLYINNQLVSRGLLRDGHAIDFAQLGHDEHTSTTTAGRIISLVNDLILRRDRDAEQRESVSVTIRNLRAENLKLTSDVARLVEKNAEEKRRADIAIAGEAALKTQLKSAEANARGQKEEIARMKNLVSQSRAACATEVRRRDRQIDTLKKQLAEAGRSRGSRQNAAVTTIHVTGDFGAEKESPLRNRSMGPEECDLRSETNAFLAKLAQDLSEENETILKVMQQTMGQLREMSGYQEGQAQSDEVLKRPNCEELAADLASVTDHMRTILTNPSFVPIEEVEVREEEINRLRSGWVKMESRWKEAVHLIDGWRKRMAASGKPVCDEELRMGLRLSPVRVMDVDETKGAFDMRLPSLTEEAEEEDEHRSQSPCPPNNDHIDLVPEPSDDEDDGSDGGASSHSDYGALDGNEDVEEAVEAPAYQPSPDSSPLPEPPQLSPLRNSASAGNRGSLKTRRLRPKLGDFTTIVEERTQELAQEPRSMRSVPLRPRAPVAAAAETSATTSQQRRVSSRPREQRERARSPSRTSLDSILLAKPRASKPAEAGSTTASRRAVSHDDSRRLDESEARHSDMDAGDQGAPVRSTGDSMTTTIAAKLAASEREADAARVRAKLRAASRGSSRGGVSRPDMSAGAGVSPAAASGTSQATTSAKTTDVDPVKHDVPSMTTITTTTAAAVAVAAAAPDAADELSGPSQPHPQPQPEKRKRDRKTSKAASRRRSTLSPLELEALITGGAAA